MSSELEMLRDMNVDIGNRESDGDVEYFKALLAPTFAMRRSNGVFNNRDEFLAGVTTSPLRQTENPSVTLFSDTCAVVSCVVSTTIGVDVTMVHNLRVFTRADTAAKWRLLAWSNSRIP